MDSPYIDFISAYCDRWCERCAFTDRCSAFACNAAIAMCGDVAQGIELAVGRPRSPEDENRPPLRSFPDVDVSDAEIAEACRIERARDERVEQSPVLRMARAYMNRTTAWIDGNRAIDDHPDLIVREAFHIVCWDAHFIHVKLHRALRGLDRDDADDDGVQSDANGSAKVALLSIDRSANAWQTLAAALTDVSAVALGDALRDLRNAMLELFPQAMAFVRPWIRRGVELTVVVDDACNLRGPPRSSAAGRSSRRSRSSLG
jgi:hypothetical protein